MFGTHNNAVDILKKIIEMKENGEIPKTIKFFGQTRVDHVTSEIIEYMKKAGFMFLSFGVESFSDVSLQSPDINKKVKAQDAVDSVKISLEAKIPITNINLILLHPTIKKSSFITTIE